MGLMELPRTEPGQLIVTPHPMLLEGQRTVVWEARAGESLYALLMRNVPELDGQPWAVSIGGVVVERHLWHCVYPKQGQVVEVRGGVGKTALMVVAMIALTYFTMGAGAGWIAGAFGVAAGGMGATMIGAGLFIAGSMLVNKVLGPKPAKTGSQSQDSVYSLSGARNQLRQYEPLPMLFGKVRITPDLLGKPYTWYEGNDQYLGLQLCAGINVGRVEEIYNGDTLLSSYEGAKVYHAGYSQMPDQAIPLYSNADVIDGGQLLDTSSDPKHTPSAWIERTSSADTVRLVVGLEYQLYDKTSKGKDKNNTERVEIQYRPTGTTGWLSFGNYTLNSSQTKAHRAGYGKDVARGQYDVRVRTAGLNTNGSGAQAAFTWTTLTSVQVDEGDYTGISRTGLELKATGQLNGTPDELRAIGYADPIPVWDGSAWTTEETSNPGAQILAYARGISRGGRLLGGMALDEDQIDVESLKAFTLHCAANGYAYNFHTKDARNHEQVLSAIALAGFGQITWAGGRLGVVWAAQDQPLSGVVNMGTIKKGQFQVDYSLSNAADGIEYTYIDEETWETKTLRVPAPGVTTMLNPAQVTGEGVTTEEHAARMARWHLAQSLYQYKDVSYSTDIEHLSYQRLSVLAMQHDMTQWGHGGRVVAAADSAGTMTLHLDEPVPAPPSGVGYIGLRIPGERVYRVMKVKPFTGESDTIELSDPWPSDAAVPGAMPNNPAHDTLWIYDFKQTPGLRVRVVSVEPESDLKGASVRVVQEGAEFWNYVLTGDYVSSPSGSLLQTRPVASNLRVTEQQVVQGNTTYTELTATFDVSGPVSNVVVRAAVDGQELEEVAQTQTRMATWRIPSAGAYNIVVRPFSPDGEPGVAVSAAYVTAGAELPPKLVDLFDVEQRSGGVRIYTWGWLAETIQSPDFAGVEIRYISGSIPSPTWDSMTPVGDAGYHTAAFEAVVPASGQWTFACRSRNTAGVLSIGMRVVTRTLQANLGEQIGGIGQDLDELTRQQVAQQQALEDEQESRLQGDLQTAAAAAADASAKANAARDAAIAHADVIGAQVADILYADEWVATKAYPKGDLVKRSGKLYRALRANTNKAPESNAADWQFMGNYTSLGEAVAASISIGTQNTSDISAQATQLNGVAVRMPAGNGEVATKASVISAEQASVARDNALAERTGVVEAALPDLATKASVTSVEQASVARDNALAGRTDAVEATIPGLATKASVTAAEQASVDRDNAISTSLTQVRAAIGNTAVEIIRTGRFTVSGGKGAWGASAWSVVTDPGTPVGAVLRVSGSGGYEGEISDAFPCEAGDVFELSADHYGGGMAAGESSSFGLAFYNAAGQGVGQPAPVICAGGSGWVFKDKTKLTAPANAVSVRGVIFLTAAVNKIALWQNLSARKLSDSEVATAGGLTALTSTVDNQGGQLQSLSQSVQQVTATANGASASITNLMEVSASSNSIGLVDGGFETSKGWGSSALLDKPEMTLPANTSYATDVVRSGARALRFGVGIASAVSAFNNSWLRVRKGQKIRITYWARINGSVGPDAASYIRMSVRRFSPTGTSTYSYAAGSTAVSTLNYTWQKITAVYAVIDGDFALQFAMQCLNNNPNTAVYVDDVSVELIGEEAESARAKNALLVDVNGVVSGYVNENDGSRSSFSILGTVFRVISTLTGMGMEWLDGYLRIWKGSAQLVLGHSFGSGDLVMWYGPNVGAGNCTKLNGLFHLDTSGGGYFGGSLSAGTLKNAVQTTNTATSGVEIVNGPFSTNGNVRNVVVSYSRNHRRVKSASGTDGFVAGAGSNTAIVQVYRKIGDAAEALWQTINVSGTVDIRNEPDTADVAISTWGGSLTVNDTSPSSSLVQYRAVLSAFTAQAVTHQSGSFDSQTITQNLSIISVES